MSGPGKIGIIEGRAGYVVDEVLLAALANEYRATATIYVRDDIHKTAVDELKAAMDELRRLRDVVGDVDRESIDSALSAAGEVVA